MVMIREHLSFIETSIEKLDSKLDSLVEAYEPFITH